jgi:hypothetical protein
MPVLVAGGTPPPGFNPTLVAGPAAGVRPGEARGLAGHPERFGSRFGGGLGEWPSFPVGPLRAKFKT